MHRLLLAIFSIVLMIQFTSCVKQNEEDLSGAKYCKIDTPSFQQHIQIIINDRCMPCHNASNAESGFDLSNYTNIADIATNGVLQGVIRHESGYIPMPASAPKMPFCEIQIIDKWIEQGALNN